jgi:D-xylose 1-dehydrogenase
MLSFPEFKNQDVLVTGGANGIGAAMVGAFAQQGARVYFCDVDERAGRALSQKLGDHVIFEKVDLLKEREIRRWIDSIGAHDNGIRALVNNAALDPRLALEATTSADWDTLFARNLRAYFLTCREATKWMSEGSAIINLASITFHIAPTCMTAYVATKGGVLGFTRALARELGPRRIRVNTLSPGWVMTERQLQHYVTPATKRLIKQSQCVPDLIQPEEIASVALFLASEASCAITGQEILVDRGWAHS